MTIISSTFRNTVISGQNLYWFQHTRITSTALTRGYVIAACVGLWSSLPGSARADWWQDCTAERQRFCQGVPAGGGRVVACLDQHENELSAGCKASLAQSPGHAPQASQPAPNRVTPTHGGGASGGYQLVYQTNFQSDIDRGLMLQQPNPGALEIAAAPCQPSRRALRVYIRRQDDYSRVANGVPRAEIDFIGRLTFQTGKEYLIRWSTCLPADYKFDNQQPEGITQIHEGPNRGSPPWGMTVTQGRYEAQLRNGSQVRTMDLGSATADRGRWVQWLLHYRPDSNGANAITELDKDGARVLSANGSPNAYPNDERSYFKIGVYKWWWKERPSDVTERTMYFGDVIAEAR